MGGEEGERVILYMQETLAVMDGCETIESIAL